MWNIKLTCLPSSFCCCHNLKTGGIAIGWAGLLCSSALWWCITSTISTASMHGIVIGGTIGGLIGMVVSGCLIYGSAQGNWFFIIPWLIYAPIEAIVGICGMIETIVDTAHHFNHYSFIHPSLGVLMLMYIAFLVVITYWWFCMVSLLRNLRDEEFVLRSKALSRFKNQDEEAGPIYEHLEGAA